MRKILSISNMEIHTSAGVALVEKVNFEIAAGSKMAIIGESGSGKSLTALAISGLLSSDLRVSGEIHLSDGIDGTLEIISAQESRLTKIRGSSIAIVFQDPLSSLDPAMRVGKQLAGPIMQHQGLRGEALTQAIKAALAEVQLSDPARIAHSYPHEISGGERQRVALALALACKPKILIADEITTALDVSVQEEILELLESVVSSHNMTLIFITHDIAVASQIAEDVIVMRSGKIVESGTIYELLRSQKSEYARDLISSAKNFESILNSFRVAEGGDSRE